MRERILIAVASATIAVAVTAAIGLGSRQTQQPVFTAIAGTRIRIPSIGWTCQVSSSVEQGGATLGCSPGFVWSSAAEFPDLAIQQGRMSVVVLSPASSARVGHGDLYSFGVTR